MVVVVPVPVTNYNIEKKNCIPVKDRLLLCGSLFQDKVLILTYKTLNVT